MGADRWVRPNHRHPGGRHCGQRGGRQRDGAGAALDRVGVQEWDTKGAVRRKYLEHYALGSPFEFDFAATPSGPYGSQRYDAFGRQLQTYDLDGTVTLKSVYHALSSDAWDAADLENGSHQGTPLTVATDGHGRTVSTTERFHQGNTIEERTTFTQYRPGGQPEVITRKRASTGAQSPAGSPTTRSAAWCSTSSRTRAKASRLTQTRI
jgi:hypothetical protein